jgi:hypothetical protein
VTDDRSNTYTQHDGYWLSCQNPLPPSTITVEYATEEHPAATLYWCGVDLGETNL